MTEDRSELNPETTFQPAKMTQGQDGPTAGSPEFSLVPVDASLAELEIVGSQPRRQDHEFIGRYRVERVLGKGGFGRVYLAFDEGLDRWVAIKVPHLKRVTTAAGQWRFVEEAKTLAKLDHPHIVPVYDVGLIKDGPCFVVSKYIEGRDLSVVIADKLPSIRDSIALLVSVATALHYFHGFRLVHRDIKPANLVLGNDGRIYVVDFGLALHEEKFTTDEAGVGTPSYMSPEQLRGEAHRVDGRSDLFSLGVVMYELLTGERPFRATSNREAAQRLLEDDPVPLHQVNSQLPRELNRICLKLLSKRAAERYVNGQQLADDLQHWLSRTATELKFDSAETVIGLPADVSAAHHSTTRLNVVPRGLRSFDGHDAEFFLQLLPGVRDRDGLPESLSHWMHWIEHADDQPESRRIGVISGPSGCGKSSLVRAGLVPLLNDRVHVIVQDATATRTETQLIETLDRRYTELRDETTLAGRLAEIRRGKCLESGEKLLIVLDQFEQWLNSMHERSDTALLDALRQCDGDRVQCLVLVRDDFWLALNRFMVEVEIPLTMGKNARIVDLFDPHHARKVLMGFGRAFERLPRVDIDLTQDQQAFVTQAIANLTKENKVFPIHLALFSEMVKARDWMPATLDELGGAVGVGTQFLREAFSTTYAPAKQRRHEVAARNVLAALLPAAGTEIKASSCTRDNLLQAAGYANEAAQFNELLEVLETELKLISPVDALERNQSESWDNTGTQMRSYQLSHDFLVPSIRDWLHAQQRSTYRGRLRLSLSEQASAWNRQHHPRLLPSLTEWIQARLLFLPGTFAEGEAKMLRATDQRRGLQLLLTMVLLGLVYWGFQRHQNQLNAHGLVAQLLTTEVSRAPQIIQELEPCRTFGEGELQTVLNRETNRGPRRRILLLAWLRWHPEVADEVLAEVLTGTAKEVLIARTELAPYASTLAPVCWAELDAAAKNPEVNQRTGFRAAQMLATFDPPVTETQHVRWQQYSQFLGRQLLSECQTDPQQFLSLAESLRPVANVIRPVLEESLGTEQEEADTGTSFAVSLLSEMFPDDPESRTEFVLAAAPWQWKLLFSDPGELSSRVLNAALEAVPTKPARAAIHQARRRATAAAILELREPQAAHWQLLQGGACPDVRSHLIHRLPALGVPLEQVVQRVRTENHPDIASALLQMIGEYPAAARDVELHELVREQFLGQPDPGIHSSAEWLLRKWGLHDTINQLAVTSPPLPDLAVPGALRWRATPQGHVFVRVDAAGVAGVERVFEICTTEVSVSQHLRFQSSRYYNSTHAPTTDCPSNVVRWTDAIQYCNWLSEQAGIPKEEWCYPEDLETAVARVLNQEHLQRQGYRLPTYLEWKLACRGGTSSQTFFGDDRSLMDHYAWHELNTLEPVSPDGHLISVSHPCGTLKPNPWGLFDIYGNVMEWCDDVRDGDPDARILGGGSHSFTPDRLNSDTAGTALPGTAFDTIGFRVVRTLSGNEAKLPAVKAK